MRLVFLALMSFAIAIQFADASNASEGFFVRVEGKEFLMVALPDGTAFTRSAWVHADDRGLLVTQDGFHIVPAITLNVAATKRKIEKDGSISSVMPGSNTRVLEGALSTWAIKNIFDMKEIAPGYYRGGDFDDRTPCAAGAGCLNISK